MIKKKSLSVFFLIAIIGLMCLIVLSACAPEPSKSFQSSSPHDDSQRMKLPSSDAPLSEKNNLNIPKIVNTPELAREEKAEVNAAVPVPSDSIAIFYSDILSSVEEYVALNIQWERTDKGIIRYIPAVKRWEVMGITSSASYSSSAIYPFAIDGRLFTITDYGSDWIGKNKGFLIAEKNSGTGALIGQASITAETFAIVGNKLFYREGIKYNLYDEYSSGGELKWYLFGSSELPKMLLSYGDLDNGGELFGVGNHLLSVAEGKIREHSTITGKAIKMLHQDVPEGKFVAGTDTLYGVEQLGSMVTISQYPLTSQRKILLKVELEGGETTIDIDEDQGKLAIFTYSPAIKQVTIYDLATGTVEDLPVKPFGSYQQGSLYGFGPQIMVME